MHIKHLYNNQKGIGLIEVLASFTIALVVITSLVALSIYTVRSSLNSKLLLEGTKIASREIERVRGFRDSSVTWDQFVADLDSAACSCDSSPCASQCHMTTAPLTPVSGQTTEVIDNQIVTIYFNALTYPSNPSLVRISVYVSWNIGGVAKNTHVYTDLTNWQNR